MSETVDVNPDDLIDDEQMFSGAVKTNQLVAKPKRDLNALRLRVQLKTNFK